MKLRQFLRQFDSFFTAFQLSQLNHGWHQAYINYQGVSSAMVAQTEIDPGCVKPKNDESRFYLQFNWHVTKVVLKV